MNAHKVKVLIVDDEASIRDSVSRVLESHGYQVAKACCGKEALEIADSLMPDLLLLDVIMPGLDGYEVCRQMRSRYPFIKIIFFTAKVVLNGFQKGDNSFSQADAIVEKPASSEKIIACFRQVLAT